ncbi:hypothetical protein D9M69_506140 [compost metagenome]
MVDSCVIRQQAVELRSALLLIGVRLLSLRLMYIRQVRLLGVIKRFLKPFEFCRKSLKPPALCVNLQSDFIGQSHKPAQERHPGDEEATTGAILLAEIARFDRGIKVFDLSSNHRVPADMATSS